MLQKTKCFLLFIFSLVIFSNIIAQNSKPKLYIIPGQGSDYRIFKYFKFDNFDTVNIKYIIPDRHETMQTYAHKLATQIDTSSEYSIIGVSLGGMLAVEMSEFLNPKKVIIISSAKNRTELPFRYKFMRYFPINKIFGGFFIKTMAPIAQKIVEPDSKNNRETFKAMLKSKNKKFMKRSVNMIINWKRKTNTKNIIHIHGDSDHTIPLRNIKNPNYIIKNGSHMMTLTQGPIIIKIVNKFLSE